MPRGREDAEVPLVLGLEVYGIWCPCEGEPYHRSLLRTVVWPWSQEPRSRGITFGALVRVSREEPGYPAGAACWRSPAPSANNKFVIFSGGKLEWRKGVWTVHR